MNSIEAVLFDVGQTILSPDYPFLQKMLAENGVKTSLEQLAKGAALAREKYFRGNQNEPWKEYFSFWFTHLGARVEDLPGMLKQVYERHHTVYLWNQVEPTARQTFEALQSKGLRLGIVSNADGKVQSILNQLQLGQFFSCIVDSKIVGVEKPDPAIFRLALQALNIAAEHCIYVGDHYDRDVVGARRAGLFPVLIDPFEVVPERDVARIKTLAELVELIAKL
jgi:putative hydrolase of the HAD superfamily